MTRLTRDERLQSLRAAIRGKIKMPRPYPRGAELRAALIKTGCITPDAHRACVDYGYLAMDDAGCIEAAQTIFLLEEPEIAEIVANDANTDERVARELRVLLKLSDDEVKRLSAGARTRRRIWREIFPEDPNEKPGEGDAPPDEYGIRTPYDDMTDPDDRAHRVR